VRRRGPEQGGKKGDNEETQREQADDREGAVTDHCAFV